MKTQSISKDSLTSETLEGVVNERLITTRHVSEG
jgi:hypothetical protein